MSGRRLLSSEDCGVVDFYTAIAQHQFEIAVAHRERRVLTNRPQDHLICELPSLESFTPSHCAQIPVPLRPIHIDIKPQLQLCNQATVLNAGKTVLGERQQ